MIIVEQAVDALDLVQWQALLDEPNHCRPWAVRLPNDQDPEVVTAGLHSIGCILLDFPKWTDGRAYSQAWLLRSRVGFKGKIQATGDVVLDMLPILERCGFDSACLRGDQCEQRAAAMLSFFEGYYQQDLARQPSAEQPTPWRGARPEP